MADILGRGKADWLIFWPGFKGIDFQGVLDDVPAEALARLRGVIAIDAPDAAAAGLTAPEASAATGDRHALPRHRYADLRACADAPPPAQANTGVLCFTTSGTTSRPKFVLRPAHPAGARRGGGARLRLRAGHPRAGQRAVLRRIRLLHAGQRAGARRAGGLLPVFDAAASAREIREHAITHTYANNEALTGIMRAAAPGDLASARLFGFASFTPALDGMLDLARQQDVPLTGLYGSSELQALAAGQPTTPAGRCVGAPAAGRRAGPSRGAGTRARSGKRRRAAAGTVGRVEIRSPSLMLGYLDNPEATARAFTDDGYFKTGDLGYALSEQQFVFQARMGDSLRLAGFLVNPAEIEQVVESLPGVRACQVVGATRADKTVPYAFVLLQPGARADAAGWTAACKAVMAGFKVPAGFTALDAFPSIESANSVKIQKHRLREMAEPCSPPPLIRTRPRPTPMPAPKLFSHSPQPLYLQAAACSAAISRTAAGGPASRSRRWKRW